MSGFHLVCTLCAGFLLPWLLSSSSSIPLLHLLAYFKKGSVPDAIPLGTSWDAHPSGAKALPEAAREWRRWQGSTHRGVCGAGSQALLFLAPWEYLPETVGAELSPRKESMTKHSLVCEETTDHGVGATGCLCKVRMGKSTSIN